MRKLLTRILVFLLAVTSVFGLTGLKSVKAEEVAVSGMQIVGASLRSPAGEDAYTGIRFETTITKEAFNALKEANEGKVISFGTKISDVDGFSPVYVSYVTSENMLFVEEGNKYKYYASITFNNEDFALDVLKMLRNDDTLTTIEGATEEELLKIEKYKQASYAELLKATSYYEIDGVKYYTASLIRSMRMVANWYVEGDILNETEKAFISSKNYFTAVTPITGYNYVEQDGEIVNDNGEAYVFATKAQVAYKAQNVPVVDGKLDLSNVAFDEELGEKVTLYIFDEDNKVSELTAKYVTEYITTVAEMKKAVEIGDLSAEIAAEGYVKGDLYNKGYYVLGCDLDFTGNKIEHHVASTTAPTALYASDRPFMGVFDGQGYALKNVEVTNGIGIFGSFGGLNITAVKNLAIIGYNFPKATSNGMSPLSVLGASDSLGSNWNSGGTQFENLYITLGNINNDNNVNRRKAMMLGQVINGLTTFKNIVIEANITTAAYENFEANGAYKPAQPVFARYLSAHNYSVGATKYNEAEANSIENLIIISKDTTGNNQTFRISSNSAANEFAVAYNDKDTAKVITSKQATNFYYPEYSYVDENGKSTFVKPENYEGENNIVMRRYDDYTAFASDTKTDKTSLNKFNSNMWVVSNGAVYYKGIYKNTVKPVVKNNANEVVDEIVFDEATDSYTFNFIDSDVVKGDVSIDIKGDASYLVAVGNTVKVNGTLPASEMVEITVTQEIGAYTATASYTASVTNQKVIDNKVYFDASTGKFDSLEIKGTLSTATVTYGDKQYALNVVDGAVVGVTVENRTVGAPSAFNNIAAYKLFIKVGESEGTEVGFEIADDGNFDGISAVISTVEGSNYILNNVEFVSKVIKNQKDLAVFTVTNDTHFDFGYYVLGNSFTVVDDPNTANVNEAIAIPHTTFYNKANEIANFNGVFDGNGYTITGLKTNGYGMFASVGAYAIIRNFALYNLDATNAPYLGARLKTQTINAGKTSSPAWLQVKCYTATKLENLYVKLSSTTTSPKGLYSDNWQTWIYKFANVVIDWQDAPAITVKDGKIYEGEKEITDSVGIYTAGIDQYAGMMGERPDVTTTYTISAYPLMVKVNGTIQMRISENTKYYTSVNGVYTNFFSGSSESADFTTTVTKTLGFGRNVTTAPSGVVAMTRENAATDIAMLNCGDVASFTSYEAMKAGLTSSNVNAFTNSIYWDITNGYPIWRTLPQA